VFALFILVINFCGARMYGESEVIFSSLKIMLIVGLIIGGIVINAGGGPDGEYIGSQYWTTPGAFDTYVTSDDASRFLAFWKVLLTAAFSYGNIQVAAISGSETGNPQTVIPRAMRKTFVRVFLFYVLSVFIVGLIVPSGERGLSLSTAQRHGRRLSWPLPARASKSRRILSMRSSVRLRSAVALGAYSSRRGHSTVSVAMATPRGSSRGATALERRSMP
jgi:amino acid permease